MSPALTSTALRLASLRGADGPGHAGADRDGRPGHQSRRGHGRAGLAQHLRLQHVLLPGLAVGGRDLLRAHPSPGRLGGRPADDRARPVALWAEAPARSCAGRAGALVLLGARDRGGRRPADGRMAWSLGLTGLASLGASWVWPRCEPSPKWLRRCGLAAFVAVVLQGVLGGLRVVLFKDAIGIFHATLAQLFFVLVCAIALFTSRWWQTPPARTPSTINSQLSTLFLLTTLLILGQLALGAAMRHQHAGLAIPDFPLAYGKLWPAMDAASVAHYNQQRMEIMAVNPITAFQIGLQMIHRLLALAILGAVAFAAWSARRALGGRNLLSRMALVWLGLILTQVAAGRGNDMVEQGRGHRHRPCAGRRALLGAGRDAEHHRVCANWLSAASAADSPARAPTACRSPRSNRNPPPSAGLR